MQVWILTVHQRLTGKGKRCLVGGLQRSQGTLVGPVEVKKVNTN